MLLRQIVHEYIAYLNTHLHVIYFHMMCARRSGLRLSAAGYRPTSHKERPCLGLGSRKALYASSTDGSRVGFLHCNYRHRRDELFSGWLLLSLPSGNKDYGADSAGRTRDLLITNQPLYQLSYASMESTVTSPIEPVPCRLPLYRFSEPKFSTGKPVNTFTTCSLM